MSNIEYDIELIDLVDTYIYLQLNKPLVIDGSEPKQYSYAAFECYIGENKFGNILNRISEIMESDVDLDSKIIYGPRLYSRTEFYTMCFSELTKEIEFDDLKKIIENLKNDFSKTENSAYASFAIDKLSIKILELKSKVSYKNKTKNLLRQVLNLKDNK